MKTLFESIKSNVGIGRYRLGAHIVEDGVPCTVVLIENGKAHLLSDVYIGRNKYYTDNINPRDYIKQDGSGHFSFLKTANQTKSMKLPEGWEFPGKIYTDDSRYNDFYDILKMNLRKYIPKIVLIDGNDVHKTISNYFLAQWTKSDKCDCVYYINEISNQIFSFKSDFDCISAPVRFAKTVELQ